MALLIPPSIADRLPSMVRNQLAAMDARRQEEFVEEYRRKAKSSPPAYLLWFFLGLHYAYFRKWGLLVSYILTGGGAVVWMVVDLFRIPSITRDDNRDVAIEVMRNMKAIGAH